MDIQNILQNFLKKMLYETRIVDLEINYVIFNCPVIGESLRECFIQKDRFPIYSIIIHSTNFHFLMTQVTS